MTSRPSSSRPPPASRPRSSTEIARGHLVAYRAGNRLRIEPKAVADWKEQGRVDPRHREPMYEPEIAHKAGKSEGRFTKDLKASRRTA